MPTITLILEKSRAPWTRKIALFASPIHLFAAVFDQPLGERADLIAVYTQSMPVEERPADHSFICASSLFANYQVNQ